MYNSIISNPNPNHPKSSILSFFCCEFQKQAKLLDVRLVVTFERRLTGKGHKGYFFSFYNFIFIVYTITDVLIFPHLPTSTQPSVSLPSGHHHPSSYVSMDYKKYFGGVKKFSKFNLDGDYMGVYIGKNSSNCSLYSLTVGVEYVTHQ